MAGTDQGGEAERLAATLNGPLTHLQEARPFAKPRFLACRFRKKRRFIESKLCAIAKTRRTARTNENVDDKTRTRKENTEEEDTRMKRERGPR